MELRAHHVAALDDRRRSARRSRRGRPRRPGRTGGRRTCARGRRAPPRRAPRSARAGRANVTVFQPMCGIFSPGASSRVTVPPSRPSPAAPSCSSEDSNSSCMPRQMPEQRHARGGPLAQHLVEARARAAGASPRGTRRRRGARSPSAARRARVVGRARDARRRRARAPSRRCAGCPSRSRRARPSRQRPLRRGHAGLVRVDRTPPRAARGRTP